MTAELDDGASDGWAHDLLFAAAFWHARESPECRGFTIMNGDRARCGFCGWSCSARDGSFGLLVLSAIGLVLEAAMFIEAKGDR